MTAAYKLGIKVGSATKSAQVWNAKTKTYSTSPADYLKQLKSNRSSSRSRSTAIKPMTQQPGPFQSGRSAMATNTPSAKPLVQYGKPMMGQRPAAPARPPVSPVPKPVTVTPPAPTNAVPVKTPPTPAMAPGESMAAYMRRNPALYEDLRARQGRVKGHESSTYKE